MSELSDGEMLEALIRKVYPEALNIRIALGNDRYEDEPAIVFYPKPGKTIPGIVYDSFRDMLFDHDFARALFGEERRSSRPTGFGSYQEWNYQLMQAVISDNPILYMYNAVYGKEKTPAV